MVRLAVWLSLACAVDANATPPPIPAVGAAASPVISPSTSPIPAGQALTCADFHRLANGSWTPRRPVAVGGVALTPGVSFSRGVSFGGVDVAAVLDASCRSSRG